MRGGTGVASAFAFEDLDRTRDRLALRLRIGPDSTHCDMTYGELHSFVARTAAALAAFGCKIGDRVAVLLPHSKALITTFFAVRFCGCVPSIIAWPTVKIDRDKYERNLRGVVATLNATWLVTDNEMAQRFGQSFGKTKVCDISAIEGYTGFRTAAPYPGPNQPALIQFSGGTTGTQKSVPITFDHLASQVERYSDVLDLDERDHFVSWLPLYHDMGLVACLLLPFLRRLPVTVFSPIEWIMDPRPFLRSIAIDHSTLCWLPNFAFSFLAKRSSLPRGSLDLSSLRRVINCSEPIRAESMDAFLDRFRDDGLRPDALHTCYAMAEATFAVSQSTSSAPPRPMRVSTTSLGEGLLAPGPGPTRVLISCGRPLAETAIRVVDKTGEESPAGRIGEIWLKGPSVMDGYLQPADSLVPSRDAFTDGWFRTGDLGAVVDDHLYVTARKKDVIIVGGVNVYPEDIEDAVGQLATIRDGRVVALGLSNDDLGTEQLVVIAELADESIPESVVALEAEIRTSVLAVTGIAPKWVFIVPPKWIVKSTAGKISRGDTRSRVLQQWHKLESSRKS